MLGNSNTMATVYQKKKYIYIYIYTMATKAKYMWIRVNLAFKMYYIVHTRR